VTHDRDIREVSLTVDGRPVRVPAGSTVLEACRTAGAHVPTLCHDPRLKPFGGCRMCIVEIEGMRGYPTSCTTEVCEGQVVTTASTKLTSLRRSIVELLLSDHNVDCLTCEANGACGLQSLAYEFGIEREHYGGEKHREVALDDGPLIARDLSKCIGCSRCIRICHEVQGCDVYGHEGRGFEALPMTPFALPLSESGCEFCGQCVSTCPVGALTDRQSRFAGRPWEVSEVRSICGYCGVGCTVDYRVHRGRIVGANAPVGVGVNNGNLCAKGRYGYGFTQHPDRLTTPLVRRDGELVAVSWDEAIAEVAAGLAKTRDEVGGQAVGGLASAKCTNEENYLFQKLLRAGIGTNNIDHCARL